jgi:hypothetical protein
LARFPTLVRADNTEAVSCPSSEAGLSPMGGFVLVKPLESTVRAADVRSFSGSIAGSSVFQVSPIRRVPFNHT